MPASRPRSFDADFPQHDCLSFLLVRRVFQPKLGLGFAAFSSVFDLLVFHAGASMAIDRVRNHWRKYNHLNVRQSPF